MILSRGLFDYKYYPTPLVNPLLEQGQQPRSHPFPHHSSPRLETQPDPEFYHGSPPVMIFGLWLTFSAFSKSFTLLIHLFLHLHPSPQDNPGTQNSASILATTNTSQHFREYSATLLQVSSQPRVYTCNLTITRNGQHKTNGICSLKELGRATTTNKTEDKQTSSWIAIPRLPPQRPPSRNLHRDDPQDLHIAK